MRNEIRNSLEAESTSCPCVLIIKWRLPLLHPPPVLQLPLSPPPPRTPGSDL
jgi:hypothetical protein